jgi:hypothetical protein
LVGNVIAITIDTSYGVTVQNNTLDGIGTEGLTIVSYSDPAVSRNIISRIRFAIRCDPTTSPTFECNNVYDAYRRYTSCPDQTGLNGNFALDPQYCGIDDSGNYFLQSDSPCAPGNHPDGYDCGLIGALPVNCGTVDVQTETWGTIKSLYKGDN